MHGQVYIEELDEDIVLFGETDENGKLIRLLRLAKNECVGSIYRGKVVRVTGAGAFVDIGREKNALLSGRGYKAGDFVTVVVSRGEEGDKGAQLSNKITLAGKYAVVGIEGKTKFSRKSILSEENREKLLHVFPEGVLFRTSLTEETVEDAVEEATRLAKKVSDIIDEGKNKYKIECLHNVTAIDIADNMTDKRRGEYSDIREQVERVNDRKVVADGVELVIDRTEAMTVIDVNSHLNTVKYRDEESHAFAVNGIAVIEVCRQIRLRNIGGIIAVDFVNMAEEENIEKIKKILHAELKKDDVMTKTEFVDSMCIALVTRRKRYSAT